MSWSSYLYPRTILHASSIYNDDIRVVEEYGKNKLLVNGSHQSSGYIEHIWTVALNDFELSRKDNVKRIFVLGVAGGTVITLLSKMFPDACATGIDIDAEMIRIGKKYFGLDNIPNIIFIETDAREYVKNVDKNKKFDIIVVDLFIGRHIPSFVLSDTFLRRCKFILSPTGALIINYLREQEYRDLSDTLSDKLIKIFHTVRERKIYRNRIFCACLPAGRPNMI